MYSHYIFINESMTERLCLRLIIPEYVLNLLRQRSYKLRL